MAENTKCDRTDINDEEVRVALHQIGRHQDIKRHRSTGDVEQGGDGQSTGKANPGQIKPKARK